MAEITPRIAAEGAVWAAALGARLRGGAGPAASLYVGAGMAELPVVLMEALDLGRMVTIANLRRDECAQLDAALREVGVAPATLAFRAEDAVDVARACGPVSHVSVVSVLTDPETYPVCSGLSYGRLPPVLVDLGAFERERASIRALLDAVLGAFALPGLVSTTGDEVPWFLDWAARAPVAPEVTVEEDELPSAVVGDPIGFLRIRESENT
jgi:hypothetical protein